MARGVRNLNLTGTDLRIINLLEGVQIKPHSSPSITGEWEEKPHHMEIDKAELLAEFILRISKSPLSVHLPLDCERGKIGVEFAPREKAASN